MVKALSEPKPKPETPKPDTKPKPKPQSETPNSETPKIEVKVNKKRLEKIRKDFDELRRTFSDKEIIEKLFMLLKTKNIFLN